MQSYLHCVMCTTIERIDYAWWLLTWLLHNVTNIQIWLLTNCWTHCWNHILFGGWSLEVLGTWDYIIPQNIK